MDKLIQEYFDQKAYQKDQTELREIMNNFGSDKGSGHHNYTSFYDRLFNYLKDKEINLFEMGLGTNNPNLPSTMGVNAKPCASHYGWNKYFKNGKIYGADIDRDILIYTDDIKTWYCDQTIPTDIEHLFKNDDLKDIEFDIIIDDGLHTFNANFTFFRNSIHKLKKGGIFIIEDLLPDVAKTFDQIKDNLKLEFGLEYIQVLRIPNPYNYSFDNTLLVVQK